MDCYICNPLCDNCKPKFIVCPKCGLRTLLDLPQCPMCHEPFTEELHQIAYEEWKKKKEAEAAEAAAEAAAE